VGSCLLKCRKALLSFCGSRFHLLEMVLKFKWDRVSIYFAALTRSSTRLSN
jgi:hypothetical protein